MNYYEVLQIYPTATEEEVKKAYRKLSLKHHPDKDPQTNGKEFLILCEAYQTLSDREKRKNYDMKRNYHLPQPSSAAGASATQLHPQQQQPPPLYPQSVQYPTALQNNYLQQQQQPITLTTLQHSNNNIPIVTTLNLTLAESLKGGSFPLTIERQVWNNKESVTIYANVKPGIDHNEIIVIANEGHINDCFVKGDIRVVIVVEKDAHYKRKGLDLIYTKTISLKDALCGFHFNLLLPLGKVYTINNRRGNIISPKFQKVIPNLGVTRDNLTGDLIIVFDIEFPTTLNDEKLEAISFLL
jgi:DnaJ-class molecular chaperone